MKTYYECIPCFIHQALRALQQVDEKLHEEIIRKILAALSEMDLKHSPPKMALKIFEIIREFTGDVDLYAEVKNNSNRYILNMEDDLRNIIRSSSDKFLTGLHLAIAGNIIDFGAKHDFSDELIHREIDDALKIKLNDQKVSRFKKAISRGETILYLGDNAGEIVFDKLFIEQLPCEKIIFAVRGEHIINDILLADAQLVGLDKIVSVVSNGSRAPGTIIEDCSDRFKKIYNDADLVISKGQGNFESLSDSQKEIVFLLKIKCKTVAESLNGKVGDFVISINNQK